MTFYGRQGVLMTSAQGKHSKPSPCFGLTIVQQWTILYALRVSDRAGRNLPRLSWKLLAIHGAVFPAAFSPCMLLPAVTLIKDSPWVAVRITLKRGYSWVKDEGELNLFLCLVNWTHWIQCALLEYKNKNVTCSYWLCPYHRKERLLHVLS